MMGDRIQQQLLPLFEGFALNIHFIADGHSMRLHTQTSNPGSAPVDYSEQTAALLLLQPHF